MKWRAAQTDDGEQRRAERGLRWEAWHAWVAIPSGALLLLLFLLPVLALALRVSPASLIAQLTQPVVVDALRLSVVTSLLSTVIAVLLGTPLAYALARRRFRGRRLVQALVHVPLILPPAVAGVALLMTFGRRGLLGGALDGLGLEVAFSTAAVVLAQTFVAAPFYVRSAQGGFAHVDRGLEAISATLGVGPVRTFFRVTLPLATPALLSGMAMAWARGLGEFGATMMFAGNFPGRTQTMPLAVYSALQTDLDASLVLSLIMVALSFAVLVALYLFLEPAFGGHDA